MNIRYLKILLITFSVLSGAALSIVFACFDDGSNWFGYSDFTPETFADNSYKPLFYSPNQMFYDIRYDNDHKTRFSEEIVKDWSDFLKNKMQEADIRYFLLNDSSRAEIDGLYRSELKNINNSKSNSWHAIINFNDNDVREFIEFLYLAKQVEMSSVNSFNYWDYENAVKQTKVDPALISQIERKFQTASNRFLKDRYWFQTLKAYFYSDLRTGALAFFEKTKNDVSKNTLYYRALSYIAGIEYKAKNYARSNFLNSVVFDQCPALRTPAVYDFHPQNETDWNESLKLAQTNEEKAALWALLGYYRDEIRAIEEIFKLNPKNPHLDYLLTRLVNKEELNVNGINAESVVKYRSELKERLDRDALNIVNKIALSEQTSKPYFWNMANGYLQTLNGDYSLARMFFDKSEKQMPQNEAMKAQLRLLRFVNTLSEISILDTNAENKILADLNWIYFELNKSAPKTFRYEKAYSWSREYISSLYASQNNLVFAELFNSQKGFYHDNSKLEAMKSFMEKTGKTLFEETSQKIYSVSLSDIYAYQAVMMTFQNKIDDAMVYIAKADGIKDSLLPANPFNGYIKDCHDCEHAVFQKTKYSIYRFLEIIQIMQNKVKTGEDLYNNYLLLGNSFYSITHYGNARFFYEGKIISSGSTPWMLEEYYKKMLTDMSIARSYYQKAYDASTTKEQKAKCAYMLAKCERNEYYNNTIFTQSEWDHSTAADFLAWNGFKLLKTQYSDTKYYQDVIRDCDYFSKYIGN